jgi:hypothetical protein
MFLRIISALTELSEDESEEDSDGLSLGPLLLGLRRFVTPFSVPHLLKRHLPSTKGTAMSSTRP